MLYITPQRKTPALEKLSHFSGFPACWGHNLAPKIPNTVIFYHLEAVDHTENVIKLLSHMPREKEYGQTGNILQIISRSSWTHFCPFHSSLEAHGF